MTLRAVGRTQGSPLQIRDRAFDVVRTDGRSDCPPNGRPDTRRRRPTTPTTTGRGYWFNAAARSAVVEVACNTRQNISYGRLSGGATLHHAKDSRSRVQ